MLNSRGTGGAFYCRCSLLYSLSEALFCSQAIRSNHASIRLLRSSRLCVALVVSSRELLMFFSIVVNLPYMDLSLRFLSSFIILLVICSGSFHFSVNFSAGLSDSSPHLRPHLQIHSLFHFFLLIEKIGDLLDSF